MNFIQTCSFLMIVTISSPCVARISVPTTRVPVDPAATTLANMAAPPPGGAGNANLEPQGDTPHNLRPKGHQAMPKEFFDQLAPDQGALGFLDKTPRKTAPARFKNVNVNFPDAGEQTQNFLPSLGSGYFRNEQPLSLYRPEIPPKSFIAPNRTVKLPILNLFSPAVPQNQEPQALQINRISTRSWATIAGWRPGESAYPKPANYHPHFNLLWMGVEPR
jgi:hypothetical protein